MSGPPDSVASAPAESGAGVELPAVGEVAYSRPRRRRSLLEWVTYAANLAAGANFLLMMALVAVSTISRYVFDSPMTGIQELSGFMLAFGVFMGLGYTFRTGGHIRAGVFVDRFPSHSLLRRSLAGLAGITALVWSAALLYALYDRTSGYLESGRQSVGTLQAPLWIPTAFMLVGAALLLLEVLAWLVRLARGREPTIPYEDGGGL